MKTTSTVHKAAKNLVNQFHEQVRTSSGEKFWSLKPDNYDNYINIVRNIHGTEFLPDDYRYSMIVSILDKVQEYDDLEDVSHEIIDGLVDFSNYELTKWLSSHVGRAEYVNEAVSEIGYPDDIYKAIQYGQYREIEELYNNVMEYLNNEAQK